MKHFSDAVTARVRRLHGIDVNRSCDLLLDECREWPPPKLLRAIGQAPIIPLHKLNAATRKT